MTAKKCLAYYESKHKYPELNMLTEWVARFKGKSRGVGRVVVDRSSTL